MESAASHAINESRETAPSASPFELDGQISADADLSALVDEVSVIEAKLNDAIAMIASVDPDASADGDKR